jgi:hypothetical protein
VVEWEKATNSKALQTIYKRLLEKSIYGEELKRLKGKSREQLVKEYDDLADSAREHNLGDKWNRRIDRYLTLDRFGNKLGHLHIEKLSTKELREEVADLSSELKASHNDYELAAIQYKNRYKGRQKARAYKSYYNH